MHQQVGWLASVLEARTFPLARLARDLELASEVTRQRVDGDAGERMSVVLDDAADFVRSRATFLALGDYEQAAAAGDLEAAFHLGVLLGASSPPDLVGARHWWEQAATAGHAEAAFHLAVLLHTRLDPPDPAGARRWYEQAAGAGNTDAQTSLSALLAEPDADRAAERPRTRRTRRGPRS